MAQGHPGKTAHLAQQPYRRIATVQTACINYPSFTGGLAGRLLPSKEYAEMMRLLDNPPPWADFYLQMKKESERLLNDDRSKFE
jgi:hypothetical protein